MSKEEEACVGVTDGGDGDRVGVLLSFLAEQKEWFNRFH